MLNCIMATTRPKSGTKRPRTPVSFMCRNTTSGALRDVRISTKRRFASGVLRKAGLMRFKDRVASRVASGWVGRLWRGAGQKKRGGGGGGGGGAGAPPPPVL